MVNKMRCVYFTHHATKAAGMINYVCMRKKREESWVKKDGKGIIKFPICHLHPLCSAASTVCMRSCARSLCICTYICVPAAPLFPDLYTLSRNMRALRPLCCTFILRILSLSERADFSFFISFHPIRPLPPRSLSLRAR
jgi:hypothetical protein